MSGKKVSDIILDKLAENLKKDVVFKEITDDLAGKIKEEKYSKEEITTLLKKTK